MPDLMEHYFGKDMSEEEVTRLGETLLSQDDTALKLAEEVEKSYYRYGLPEPQWTGPDHPPFRNPGAGTTWIWMSLFLVAGVALFLARHQVKPLSGKAWAGGNGFFAFLSNPDPVPVSKTKSHLSNEKRGDSDAPQKEDPESLGTFSPTSSGWGKEARRLSPSSRRVEKAEDLAMDRGNIASSTLALSQPPAASTPIAWNQATKKAYSNLSVVVDQADLGFVTVRVLDESGAEITSLYRGNLGPGKWIFGWDGKLPGLRPAAAGYYQIEVRSGSQALRKDIEIRK